jgi:hypothetical protein
MKKKKKYLPLYKRWMKQGHLTGFGLCHALVQSDPEQYDAWCNERFEIIQLFRPDDVKPNSYWASGKRGDALNVFTSLRQNIILLLAAYHDEL